MSEISGWERNGSDSSILHDLIYIKLHRIEGFFLLLT